MAWVSCAAIGSPTWAEKPQVPPNHELGGRLLLQPVRRRDRELEVNRLMLEGRVLRVHPELQIASSEISVISPRKIAGVASSRSKQGSWSFITHHPTMLSPPS